METALSTYLSMTLQSFTCQYTDGMGKLCEPLLPLSVLARVLLWAAVALKAGVLPYLQSVFAAGVKASSISHLVLEKDGCLQNSDAFS